MKNTIKFFGIIVLAAAIGFSMTACGDVEDNGGLTITGLGKYNGKFAIAVEDSRDDSGLIAAAGINLQNETVTGGKISNGSVTLKVWKAESDDKVKEYSGNDSVSFYVIILKNAAINASTFAGIEDNSDGSLILILEKIAGFGTLEVIFKKGIASGEAEIIPLSSVLFETYDKRLHL